MSNCSRPGNDGSAAKPEVPRLFPAESQILRLIARRGKICAHLECRAEPTHDTNQSCIRVIRVIRGLKKEG